LELIESGQIEEVPAPQLAIEYYNLPPEAMLSDMIRCVRADEQHHADVNLRMAGGRTKEEGTDVSVDAGQVTGDPSTTGIQA
jgi:hypothetical protein